MLAEFNGCFSRRQITAAAHAAWRDLTGVIAAPALPEMVEHLARHRLAGTDATGPSQVPSRLPRLRQPTSDHCERSKPVRAAVLQSFGEPLAVRDVPSRPLSHGEVRVRILATCVLPYAQEVFSGARRYPLEPPVVPGGGGIGRVLETDPGATSLQVGDTVWADPTVRSRDGGPVRDITLQGVSSRGDGGARLARHWHDGTFAEEVIVPTENAVAIQTAGQGTVDVEQAARWAGLGVPLICYGGLDAGGLQAGETVLVSGATGNFGSAAVAVAHAMGAARVVALGRNERVLADLVDRFGARVVPVPLSGDTEADTSAARDAAGGAPDLVFDILPPSADTSAVRAAAMTVREYGRIVLMGGVGMLGGQDLALPYPWLMRNSVTVRGQWMYQLDIVPRFLAMVRHGVLDLSHESVVTFPLDEVEQAVGYAAEHSRLFHRTVLLP